MEQYAVAFFFFVCTIWAARSVKNSGKAVLEAPTGSWLKLFIVLGQLFWVGVWFFAVRNVFYFMWKWSI